MSPDRDGTAVPWVERASGLSRVSCVRNMVTMRHEALNDRAEVKGFRRRVPRGLRTASGPGRTAGSAGSPLLSLARRLLTFLTCGFVSWTVLFAGFRP